MRGVASNEKEMHRGFLMIWKEIFISTEILLSRGVVSQRERKRELQGIKYLHRARMDSSSSLRAEFQPNSCSGRMSILRESAYYLGTEGSVNFGSLGFSFLQF